MRDVTFNVDKVNYVYWRWATAGPNSKRFFAMMDGGVDVEIDEDIYSTLCEIFTQKFTEISSG